MFGLLKDSDLYLLARRHTNHPPVAPHQRRLYRLGAVPYMFGQRAFRRAVRMARAEEHRESTAAELQVDM
jgi:hypothetical protein